MFSNFTQIINSQDLLLRYFCVRKMLISFTFSSIEEDFMNWKDNFWPAVCEHFGIEATGEDIKHVKFYKKIVYFPFIEKNSFAKLSYMHCLLAYVVYFFFQHETVFCKLSRS